MDYLKSISKSDTTCIVCIYCSHQQSGQQTPVNFLASILKQMIQDGHPILDGLHKLYKQHTTKATRPTLEEISGVLRAKSDQFKRLFVVVDALDECDDIDGCRESLLTELQNLGNINLMITSRPHIGIDDPVIKILQLEIRANDEDLGKYVDGRIKRQARLAKHAREHANLQEDIRRTIIETARGMCVASSSPFLQFSNVLR